MAIELLPFMRAPSLLSWNAVTAEQSARVTSDLSLKIGEFLVNRLGYVYAQRPDEDGFASVYMQLQLPDLCIAEVSRADIITPDVDFSTQIMTPNAVHMYNGSASIDQPSTVRFDFTHDQFHRLTEGEGVFDMHAEPSGIGSAGGVSYAVVAKPEAAGLMDYLETGRPIVRSNLDQSTR